MTRITSKAIVIAGLAGSMAVSAHAAECEDANAILTAEQQAALASAQVTIVKPVGEVLTIKRCDINEDNWVDISDIRAIALDRNRPVSHPDDPMDWDKSGFVDLLDVRGCQLACAAPRCAPMPAGEEEPEQMVGGLEEAAECFQAEDLDNDGEVDQVVAVTEAPAGDTRSANAPNLDIVIVREVEGEQKVVTVPYAGKSVEGKVVVHVGKQAPGVINLEPGTLEITETATVSYRHGKPEVLYFWKDGELHRAPYRVDD